MSIATLPPQLAEKAATGQPDPEKRDLASFRPDALLDDILCELAKSPSKGGWGVTRAEAARRLAALAVFHVHPAYSELVATVATQTRRSFTMAAQIVRLWCNAARVQVPDVHPAAMDFEMLARLDAARKRGTLSVLAMIENGGKARYSPVITDEQEPD